MRKFKFLQRESTFNQGVIDWNRGAFRLWLVITVVWGGYFAWSCYSTYVDRQYACKESLEWSGKIDKCIEKLDKAKTQAEKERLTESLDNAQKGFALCSDMSNAADEQLQNAYIWGPSIPLGLPVIWFLGRWVLLGFMPRSRADRRSAGTQEQV
ncbi:MAG: hypothetical protein ACLP3B_13125 [Syntrophobacteraceae bacterium]